jgi:nucleotide-binding universal stress UspA family protein
MKKILFPTDFSKNADNALKFLLDWTSGEQIALTIIHSFYIKSVPSEFNSFQVPEEIEKVKETIESNLLGLVEKIKSSHPHVQVSMEILQAMPASAIAQAADRLKVDFIVIGTKGASGLDRLLFGSVASGVIEHANQPVLVVPHDAEFNGFQKLVYATDYKLHDIGLIKKAVEFASFYKSALEIVHSSKDSYDDEDVLKWFSKLVRQEVDYEKMNFKLIGLDESLTQLNAYLVKEKADLLIMNTTKRVGFLERLINKSLTKEMVYHTDLPLLVFNEKYN